MAIEGLSAQNHALVLRLLRVCAISPQMADVLVARWSQANLLLDAARDEGLAAPPEPVGHGLAEEGRIKIGQPMPYVCPACQAIPTAGYCSMAGCPTAPAKTTSPPSSVDVAEGRRLLREAEEAGTGDLEEWVVNNLPALLDSAERLDATIAERDALKAEVEVDKVLMSALTTDAKRLQSSHDLALAEAERLREALEAAATAMDGVTVFVTSREQIKKPEGHEWWADAIEAARAALNPQEPDHAR